MKDIINKYIYLEIYIYILYITDRNQMVRCFFWVEELVSSILAYLILIKLI